MSERITIEIVTEGAAFDDFPAREVASILRDLAAVFGRDGIPGGKLRDSNGNTCGSVTIRAEA
jgi:hypothetical protein